MHSKSNVPTLPSHLLIGAKESKSGRSGPPLEKGYAYLSSSRVAAIRCLGTPLLECIAERLRILFHSLADGARIALHVSEVEKIRFAIAKPALAKSSLEDYGVKQHL